MATTSSTSSTSSPIDGAGNRREARELMFKKLGSRTNSFQTPSSSPAEVQAPALPGSQHPIPLRHEWVLWHERNNPNASEENWADQLKEMKLVNTVGGFWQVWNHTPFGTLQLRDSFHLFKRNVKPLWEDRRNKNGGAWTFRVPKINSQDFWKEILMMAIGEKLQEVVERGDDICGVSMSARFNSHLIMIWNRDGTNQKSIDAILKRSLELLPESLMPQQQNYYYKKHSAHKSFKADATATPAPTVGAGPQAK